MWEKPNRNKEEKPLTSGSVFSSTPVEVKKPVVRKKKVEPKPKVKVVDEKKLDLLTDTLWTSLKKNNKAAFRAALTAFIRACNGA